MDKPYRPKKRAEIRRNMSAIRSRDNRTETALRKVLHGMGFRYRKYSSELVGKPDIIFPREKIAVFVDGDYWHGRLLRERGIKALKKHYTKKQQEYWLAKIQRNVARDDFVTDELQLRGWLVLRFWESDIKQDIRSGVRLIAKAVKRRRKGTLNT